MASFTSSVSWQRGPSMMCPCRVVSILRSLSQIAHALHSFATNMKDYDSITPRPSHHQGRICLLRFSWSRLTNHFFLFLRLWMFFVGLAVTSKPSNQPIRLKILTHCNLVTNHTSAQPLPGSHFTSLYFFLVLFNKSRIAICLPQHNRFPACNAKTKVLHV